MLFLKNDGAHLLLCICVRYRKNNQSNLNVNAKYGHAIDDRLSGLNNTIITYAFVCILGCVY